MPAKFQPLPRPDDYIQADSSVNSKPQSTPKEVPEVTRTATTGSDSWKPTRKWLAALVGSVATILAHFAATDFTFGDTEQGMIVTAVSALVLAYLRRNDPTLGGVPANNGR